MDQEASLESTAAKAKNYINEEAFELPSSVSARSKSSRRKRKEPHFVLKTPVKKKNICKELTGAVAIYLICISFPTIFGVLVRWYERHFSYHRESSALEGNELFDESLEARLGSRFISSGQESFSYLAKNAFDVLLSCYSNQEKDKDALKQMLLNVPASVYLYIMQYIHRDALSDVQFVTATSIFLSLIRVLLVHLLVPKFLAPRRLVAMVHSKSTHLLSSSEYEFKTKKGQHHLDDDSETSSCNSPKEYINELLTQTAHSLRRSLGHEVQEPYEKVDPSRARQMFQAPRFATAVFRLLFCMVSCSWALIKFSSSNFWPLWVGGMKTAQTKNCWDLAGTFKVKGASLDTDFDHRNSALRYFFLGQAAYQIHSLCFHCLSMILLFFYGGSNGMLSARQSLKSYLRPLLEHFVYFVLTVATYIFSGLRRIGAISIFALEASSMMLQLLQICINAPSGSFLHNKGLVNFVYRFVAIPSFVYFRFFVMPFIVQYSAAFESTMWLQNIEHALTPGVGSVIYGYFNGMLLMAFAFNFIYLRRLLFHPYMISLGKGRHSKME